jgi:hypothetical protein
MVDERDIRAFIRAHRERLSRVGFAVGTWYSPETDRTYIDVSALIADEGMAQEYSARYNQEGYYSLQDDRYVSIGGTGDPTEILPPEEERILEQHLWKGES